MTKLANNLMSDNRKNFTDD